MKKILSIILAVFMVVSMMTVFTPNVKATCDPNGVTVYIYNYNTDSLYSVEYYKAGTFRLPDLSHGNRKHYGYIVDGRNIGFTLTAKCGDVITAYAIWDKDYYDYDYDYHYRRGYNHPALQEALDLANKFESEYEIDINNAPYNLRMAYEKAKNRVENLYSHYNGYYWNKDYKGDRYYSLRERYYKRFGYYPTDEELYKYFGYDGYYDNYYSDSAQMENYYKKYGSYPNIKQFYQEYGYYPSEYPYYDSYYDPYYNDPYYGYNKYYSHDYSIYNEDVMFAVNNLYDKIRDIARYYTGPIFRDYGNLQNIKDGYYKWDGYYGYVPVTFENKLKNLINEANDLLKGKDKTLYSELYALLEGPISYAESTIHGRGDVKTASEDLENAIAKAKEYKVPANRFLKPYMKGDTLGKFHPDKVLTRGELAVILNRILGIATEFSGEGWAERAAKNLQGYGYLKGDPNGNLLLDKPITMKEMATLLVRMRGYSTVSGNAYPGRATWATPYIQRAYVEGWLEDMREVFPETELTRGQVARMINRAFNRTTIEGRVGEGFSDVPKIHKYYEDIMNATSTAFTK